MNYTVKPLKLYFDYKYLSNEDQIAKSISSLSDLHFTCFHDESNSYAFKTSDGNWQTLPKTLVDDNIFENLFKEFDVPIDSNECIEDKFLHFDKGSNREDIFYWFDDNHSKGLYFLMFPSKDD